MKARVDQSVACVMHVAKISVPRDYIEGRCYLIQAEGFQVWWPRPSNFISILIITNCSFEGLPAKTWVTSSRPVFPRATRTHLRPTIAYQRTEICSLLTVNIISAGENGDSVRGHRSERKKCEKSGSKTNMRGHPAGFWEEVHPPWSRHHPSWPVGRATTESVESWPFKFQCHWTP